MRELAPWKPLPPQRWGFLPTLQFWALAFLTPLAFVYYLGVVIFVGLVRHLGYAAWWQIALALLVFHEIWGGLLERVSRRYLARRQRRRLSAPFGANTDRALAGDDLALESLPTFTIDDFELFYTRCYGRASGLVRTVSSVAFVLLLFYPSWITLVLALLWLVTSSLVVRSCTKRWKLDALRAPPRDLPAGGEGATPMTAAAATCCESQGPGRLLAAGDEKSKG